MTRLPPSAAGRRVGVAWAVGSGPSDPRGGGIWPAGPVRCRVRPGGVFVKIFSLARGNRTLLVVTAFLFSLAVHHRRGNVRRDCDVAGRCVRPSVGRWPALRILRRLGPERGRKESEEKLLEGSVRAPHVIEPQQSLFGF